MTVPITQDPGMARLDGLSVGTCGIVAFLTARDVEVLRLKALGVCIGRRIEVIRTGDPLIVRAFGTRIGLSAQLARHVFVDVCGYQHPGATPPSHRAESPR